MNDFSYLHLFLFAVGNPSNESKKNKIVENHILSIMLTILELPRTSDRRSTDATICGATHAYNALVNGGLNAIVLLDVKLRKSVVVVHRGITDITKSRGINDVSHGKTLDSFVLRDGLRGRDTSVIDARQNKIVIQY